MNRAFYSALIDDFIADDSDSIYGKISGNFDLNNQAIQQSNAWKSQIKILKKALENFQGKIILNSQFPAWESV